MFEINVVEIIRTHILFNNFIRKSCLLCDNVGKGGVGQVKYDNITRPMYIECWITEAINTHLEHVLLIAFP
jgi:hypothetical protein